MNDVLSRTIQREVDGLLALKEALAGDEAFTKAVLTLLTASRVITTGMGKSGHVAQKVASTLSSTGTPAVFVHPSEAAHGDLGIIRKDDAVLALSWSGESPELGIVVSYTRRFTIPLLAITADPGSALARAADVPLILPQVQEACPMGLAPTTSTTMQMVLGDCLALALLERRGFTPEQFKSLHPGGKLGAKLRFVSDLMHRNLPLVAPQALMRDVVITMTAYAFGCVGVTDPTRSALLGVITDGDLRRHIHDEGLLNLQAGYVMTKQPKTVSQETMAATALELMNSTEITALFVVNGDNVPIGIIHVHDLLRAGAA